MGWLLINKSKSKKKKGAAKKAKREKWDPARTLAVLRFFGGVAIVLVIVGAWVLGADQLRAAISTRGMQTEPLQVQLVDVPQWMPQQVTEDLQGIVKEYVSADPFDVQSLQDAAAALGSNPWIQKLHRVRRQPGNIIEVHAEYREHAALIGTESGYHLIGSDGVRLPYTYEPFEAHRTGLPILVGVMAGVPECGQAWPGEDWQAGLKLARFIMGRDWAKHVVAVDVTNHNGRLNEQRGFLKLATRLDGDKDPFNNPGIEWGRPPAEEQFLEARTAWKLQRVELDYSKYRSLTDRIISVVTEPGWTALVRPNDSVAISTP